LFLVVEELVNNKINNMNIELKYPIIAFAKKNIIHFARNNDDLTICSRRGLKNGFYDGLVIVDSDGNKFEIDKAQKIGTSGFFFGINLIYGQKLKLKLIFSNKVEKMSIEEFKESINRVFRNNEYFWNSDGELNYKKSYIKDSNSFSEIIEYFTSNFYKKR
jgi:hypothetical protein